MFSFTKRVYNYPRTPLPLAMHLSLSQFSYILWTVSSMHYFRFILILLRFDKCWLVLSSVLHSIHLSSLYLLHSFVFLNYSFFFKIAWVAISNVLSVCLNWRCSLKRSFWISWRHQQVHFNTNGWWCKLWHEYVQVGINLLQCDERLSQNDFKPVNHFHLVLFVFFFVLEMLS